MEDREVQYQAEAGQARLTINREAARNALSPLVVNGLIEGLARAEADDGVRVVVLTGAGEKVFCAGGDLGGMSSDGFLSGHDSRRRYAVLLDKISTCRVPVIARVNGHALAGGLGLMLSCDLVVASETAGFGTPEIDRGLFPMMMMALLQRHLGRKRALELMLLGERLDAKKALEWGLVNQVVPAAELEAAANAMAQKVAGKSRAILALGRRAFYTTEDLPLAQAYETLANYLSLNVLAEDAAEGVTAFLEKRKPQWKDR
ncbi:MAG: enoyl-CoA hydratase-related protein [Myxococcaceae bacterium]